MTPTLVIVQGEEWRERKDGSSKRRLIWTDVRMFRKNAWQIVASQDSVAPFGQPLLS
jgi:hypothetical protein